MPLSKLRRLEKMIDRSSKFEDMSLGSQAIVPLCAWLIALVDYHYAKMAVQPYKDRLAEAEKTLLEVSTCSNIQTYSCLDVSAIIMSTQR